MRIPSIESIQHPYRHVYVSPHIDDAVLSCGGRIAMQLRRGESVLIVTVFTGDVERERKPRGVAFDQINDMKARRSEDIKAMERLGVDYLWLDYMDSIFRYKNPIFRFGLFIGKSNIEAELFEMIRGDIRKICEKAGNRKLFIPLGAGQHRDHHILFQVAKQIIDQPTNDIDDVEIDFYEDVPYVFFPNVLKYRMKLIGAKTSSDYSNIDLIHRKSIIYEVLELYKEIIEVPTLKFGNILLKPFVFFALTVAIIFVELLSKCRIGGISEWKLSPEIYDVSDVIPEKLAANMEYQTQLKASLWDKKGMKIIFQKYSESIGGREGQYVERYWKTGGD
ncbi:PIG-L family deacetylase [Deltaproteobacteria bacterium]|nr:PIG-L family deacetylase [Deltaproteobacteria bacterium]